MRPDIGTLHEVAATLDRGATARDEQREFFASLARSRRQYIGLGDEAEMCGRWAMLKSCENGHYLLKTINCGREWCPICGQDHSEAHSRRISRLAPRVFAMEVVGYMILEVPLALRGDFESPELLRQASSYLRRLLKREFGSRGVSRWHWFGDPQLNEFSGELELTKYHPHLNILLEHGFIGKKQLKRIRRLWSQWIYRHTGRRYYKTAPVYYRYYKAMGKRYHLVEYITRPTFKHLNDYNVGIAKGLYGFTNQSWFGEFTQDDKDKGRAVFREWAASLEPGNSRSVVEIQAHEAFNSNTCPICGAPLILESGKEKSKEYEAIREFGGGLFEVRAPPWAQLRDGIVYAEDLPPLFAKALGVNADDT